MTNGRARAGRLILAVVVLVAGLVWLQPYSFFSPYRPYEEIARRFLRAGLAQDTLELKRQAVAEEPIEWVLKAARANPVDMAVWARLSRPYSGRRLGDTTIVVFQTSTRVCYLRPVAMSFLKTERGPRVLQASSACLAGR